MGGGTEGKINKMSDEGNTMMEVDLKRSLTYGAETTAKCSNITYQSSNITRMSWPDGRYFGEAGGSGKSMIHQFGENVGRYTIAGAEL